MNEIIEISQPAPSSCQERIMNGPIGAVHSDKEWEKFRLAKLPNIAQYCTYKYGRNNHILRENIGISEGKSIFAVYHHLTPTVLPRICITLEPGRGRSVSRCPYRGQRRRRQEGLSSFVTNYHNHLRQHSAASN